MITRCQSFESMAKEIKSHNKRIVMFGAGAIGTTTTLGILKNHDLLSHISCYLDNDSNLWGTKLKTVLGEYNIESPKYLEQCTPDKTVVLINISRYFEVLKQLDNMTCTEKMVSYIIPMMCIHNFKPDSNQNVIKKFSEPVIPKVIHYMWLGGKTLPDNLQKCVDSWKKCCPDYEIKCWNESNYDIEKNLYMKQAYENKAYGFVPDYARLDILYNHGGIYMDTDVELKRSLDDLLYQEAFCSVEKWQLINFGGCSGGVKGNKFINKLLEFRETIPFINANGTLNRNTCGYYDTSFAMNNGYHITGKNQTVLDMTIYTSDYFHPFDYMSGKCEPTDNTFSIHHFNGGWLTEEQREANKKVAEQYDVLYKKVLDTN